MVDILAVHGFEKQLITYNRLGSCLLVVSTILSYFVSFFWMMNQFERPFSWNGLNQRDMGDSRDSVLVLHK